MTTDRRRFLRLCGVAGIGAIAGCSDSSTDETPTADQATPTTTETTTETPPPLRNPTQQAKLAATDGDSDDNFGRSVTLSSDGATALIGASNDEDPNGSGDELFSGAGSAYVFDRAGGSWTQQAKLVPDDGDSNDGFGGSVALSSDGATALISAPEDEDPNGNDAGSAYVFERMGGSWTQQAKLAPDDGDGPNLFGHSVTLSSDGTTALIGASLDEDPNGDDAGSAYVFDRANSSWTQQAKLAPDDGDSDDYFGRSVTLSSDGATALIGAHRDDDPNGGYAGSAYVFDRADGSWTQQTKLIPDDGDSDDLFGVSVTLSSDGSTALIGANRDEDPNGGYAGSAYVFDSAGGSWTQQAKLAPDDGDSEDYFGYSVTLSSDSSIALICAPRDEDPNGDDAGSAYVFDRANGSWTQQAKLSADDGDGTDLFGFSVTLSSDGSTALIGAHQDEDPNGNDAGSVYVFE